MVHADCHHPSTDRGTHLPVKPAGTVLVIAKARLMRDMIGKILTDGGYIVLGADRHDGEPTFGPPLSGSTWKADFVILVHEKDEISRDALDRIRHSTSGKIVLLLRENWAEEVSKEVLIAVDGALNDEVSAEALLHALTVIQRGERVVCRHLARLFERQSIPVDTGQRKATSLSPREKEIISRLAQGESNKVIGHGLHITEATVKVHLKAILRKISAQNRTQAAIWAVNNGFDQNID
jgi:two-component system, NarL family, nitrate/nitrite response regulator NarL